MDLVFEFEAAYGYPVEAVSWPKFVQGVRRTGRFTARALFHSIVGPQFALAGMSSEGLGQRQMTQDQIADEAFGRRIAIAREEPAA